MKKIFNRALEVVIGIGVFASISVVFGVAVMLLWNWLFPALFGLPRIAYAQAVGLFVLFRILFSGMGIGGGLQNSERRSGRHLPGDDSAHNNPFREKWLSMSDEERDEFWKHHHHSFR
jgi:hypothetical protein